MMIPFGILSAAGVSDEAGTYELIETQILGSTTPSITFSSLGTYSSTYKHLQIRAVIRNTSSGGIGTSLLRINADTGSNYAWHRLGGYGSGSAESAAGTSQTSMFVGMVPYADQAANAFAASVIDILDSYSTNKNKTVRSLQGIPGGTNAAVELRSGVWLNTASITSISLTAQEFDYSIGSRFSLYGIRG
jgi:hypothetical protein